MPNAVRVFIIVDLLIAVALFGGWMYFKNRPAVKGNVNANIATETACINELPTLHLLLERVGTVDGKQTLSFSWSPTPDFRARRFCDGTIPSGSGADFAGYWYLVRSKASNPEYNEQTHWYRSVMKYNWNSVSVRDLSPGVHHFRVGVNLGGTWIYSNDVAVTVDTQGNAKGPSPLEGLLVSTGETRPVNASCLSFEVPTAYDVTDDPRYDRIQNYRSQDAPDFVYPSGAFYLEVFAFDPAYGTPDEQETTWRASYGRVASTTFHGRAALYGEDRVPGGDSWPGISYLIKGTCTINLSAQSGDPLSPGLVNGGAVLKTAQWR